MRVAGAGKKEVARVVTLAGLGSLRVKGNIIMTGMFGGKLASDPETDLGQELQASCQTSPSAGASARNTRRAECLPVRMRRDR
ncbi:MAG: hypothetical protein HN416_12150 [Nitrospina sp.]|nr:hypothetical protein [Nitrospina sp.]